MKALVYVAPHRVELEDRPPPAAAPGQALLSVRAAGVCGSDLSGYLGHSARRRPPLVLGHEAVATILALPEGAPAGLEVGQRVTVNPLITCGRCAACAAGRGNLCVRWELLGLDRLDGTFCEQIALDARQLCPLPEQGSDELYVLAEPLANIVHLWKLLPATPATLVVIGAGTMGALTAAYAKRRGVRTIVVVDRNRERLAAARALGADHVVALDEGDRAAATRALVGPEGADVVVDAVGSEQSRRDAVACARRGGEIVLLGLAEGESRFPFADAIRNEQRLSTSFAYTAADFAEGLEALARGAIDLAPFVRTAPLEEGQAWLERLTSAPGDTLKVVLRPGG